LVLLDFIFCRLELFMNKLLVVILVLVGAAFLNVSAHAADFYGATVADQEVLTSAWKAGVRGSRPTVTDVPYGSPAAKCGLKRGHVILSANGKDVKRSSELSQLTADTLSVSVLEGTQRKTLKIDTLAIKAERATRVAPDRRPDSPAPGVDVPKSQPPVDSRMPVAAAGPKVAAPARSGDIADELVGISGIRRDLNDLFGRSGDSDIDRIFSEAYSPELAEKTVRRHLERKLTHQGLADVLAWYKTPVGKKIVEAESVLDFNKREKQRTFAGMDTEPVKERIDLMTQVEKATGVSQVETRLVENMLKKMLNAVPPDFPDGNLIKERIRNEMPSLATMRKGTIEGWAYAYRDLSMNELHDYLKFLRSANGKKYMTAVCDAIEEIFKKITLNIEKEFRTELMKQM
jgi:hypothetical protein